MKSNNFLKIACIVRAAELYPFCCMVDEVLSIFIGLDDFACIIISAKIDHSLFYVLGFNIKSHNLKLWF